MSDENEGDENPLLKEEGYTGKIFWANTPPGLELDIESLRSQLDGKTFNKTITDTVDSETTFVPEIFYKDGDIVTSSDISDTQLIETEYGSVLYGKITIDSVNRPKYRSQEVLMLDTTEAEFLVFEHGNDYFFVILGKRGIFESVVQVLRQSYKIFGSTLNETSIGGRALDEIQEEINASLRDTKIVDYPEEKIDNIQIRGDEFQDTDTYERESSRGELESYMLQTDDLRPDNPLTLEISPDCLIRIYSNATIATYLRLLHEHVLPKISRSYENSPSLGIYEDSADSIYREVKMEIGKDKE